MNRFLSEFKKEKEQRPKIEIRKPEIENSKNEITKTNPKKELPKSVCRKCIGDHEWSIFWKPLPVASWRCYDCERPASDRLAKFVVGCNTSGEVKVIRPLAEDEVDCETPDELEHAMRNFDQLPRPWTDEELAWLTGQSKQAR